MIDERCFSKFIYKLIYRKRFAEKGVLKNIQWLPISIIRYIDGFLVRIRYPFIFREVYKNKYFTDRLFQKHVLSMFIHFHPFWIDVHKITKINSNYCDEDLYIEDKNNHKIKIGFT